MPYEHFRSRIVINNSKSNHIKMNNIEILADQLAALGLSHVEKKKASMIRFSYSVTS